MQENLLFVISPPRAGSTLLQRMLGSHSQIATHPEPHLITPLAYLGYYDSVDAAPYDHINAAEAIRHFVGNLPHGEEDYLDAVRAYADTLYGRMLAASGRRIFVDKTPAYALVLPFLVRLYPDARYIVLTRHPLAVMSSYANSFFNGDWEAANAYNPVVNRYVPAMARLLRRPPSKLLHVQYEALVRNPDRELARIFGFLELPHEPEAVHYGEHFVPQRGMGDPIGVQQHARPVESSLQKWAAELAADSRKRSLARAIVTRLDPADVSAWGYDPDTLLRPLEEARTSPAHAAHPSPPRLNGYVLQRRALLAARGNLTRLKLTPAVRRLRYYCDVLLRDSL